MYIVYYPLFNIYYYVIIYIYIVCLEPNFTSISLVFNQISNVVKETATECIIDSRDITAKMEIEKAELLDNTGNLTSENVQPDDDKKV